MRLITIDADELQQRILNLPVKPYDGTDAYTHYCRGHGALKRTAAALIASLEGVKVQATPGLDERAAAWDVWHADFKKTHGYGPNIGDAWDAACRWMGKRAAQPLQPAPEGKTE
jgi:hypothetical protein